MFGGDVPYLEVPLVVTLGELFHGCSKRVTFPKHTQCDACESRGVNDAAFKPKTCKSCGGEGPSAADCDKCNGRGRVVPQDKRCPVCDGFGTLEEEGHITIKVQPGRRYMDGIRHVRAGGRVRGQGKMGAMDLVAVLVSAAPAELLKINRVVVENVADEAAAAARGKGAEPAVAAACALTPIVDDLLYMVPEGSVSLGAALTGSFVLDIPHPSGRTLRWSPPPGTPVQTGDVWLIAGEGMPIYYTNRQRVGHVEHNAVTESVIAPGADADEEEAAAPPAGLPAPKSRTPYATAVLLEEEGVGAEGPAPARGSLYVVFEPSSIAMPTDAAAVRALAAELASPAPTGAGAAGAGAGAGAAGAGAGAGAVAGAADVVVVEGERLTAGTRVLRPVGLPLITSLRAKAFSKAPEAPLVALQNSLAVRRKTWFTALTVARDVAAGERYARLAAAAQGEAASAAPAPAGGEGDMEVEEGSGAAAAGAGGAAPAAAVTGLSDEVAARGFLACAVPWASGVLPSLSAITDRALDYRALYAKRAAGGRGLGGGEEEEGGGAAFSDYLSQMMAGMGGEGGGMPAMPWLRRSNSQQSEGDRQGHGRFMPRRDHDEEDDGDQEAGGGVQCPQQ